MFDCRSDVSGVGVDRVEKICCCSELENKNRSWRSGGNLIYIYIYIHCYRYGSRARDISVEHSWHCAGKSLIRCYRC